MKALALDGFYSWSRYNHAKGMDFNGHLWVRPGGNVIIDPVPMEAEDLEHLDQLGGASLCIVTNADHRRAVAELAPRLGFEIVCHEADAAALDLPVARTLQGGETVVEGLVALHAAFGKTPGELALYFPEHAALLFGDIVQGVPVGALRVLPDEKLADPTMAVHAVRRFLQLPVDTVLVGDGCPIFGAGRAALTAALARRTDIDVFRVNVEDIPWSQASDDPRYRHQVKWISRAVGARLLAYNVRLLPPGSVSGPMHFHHNQEELFFILKGSCSLERPGGSIPLREGDFVACMADERGAHTLRNDGDAPCEVLCLSNQIEGEERELVGLVDFRFDLLSP